MSGDAKAELTEEGRAWMEVITLLGSPRTQNQFRELFAIGGNDNPDFSVLDGLCERGLVARSRYNRYTTTPAGEEALAQ